MLVFARDQNLLCQFRAKSIAECDRLWHSLLHGNSIDAGDDILGPRERCQVMMMDSFPGGKG